MSIDKSLREEFLFVIVCIGGTFESLYGILQVFCVLPSRNVVFNLTGHFDNPGPYGGFLAVITAIIGTYLIKNSRKEGLSFHRDVALLARVCLISCLIVLPATMSRTAWFALAGAMIAVSISYWDYHRWLVKHKYVFFSIIIALCSLLPLIFFLKKDSALGRLHIWRIDWLTIMDSPWIGHGKRYVMGAYGNCQEAFFKTHLDSISPDIIRVAGCPEYPFNEYLGAGMAYGLPIMLIFITITVILIALLLKGRSQYAGGAIALSLFALASYPMTYWMFWALAAICISDVNIHKEHIRIGPALSLISILIGYSNISGEKERIMRCHESFEYGYMLHCHGLWELSNNELVKTAKFSSDPLFHVIIGKILRR